MELQKKYFFEIIFAHQLVSGHGIDGHERDELLLLVLELVGMGHPGSPVLQQLVGLSTHVEIGGVQGNVLLSIINLVGLDGEKRKIKFGK